ncbi:MAG: flavin-containing monooxygenase [Myxococcota bacterium]
MSQNDFHVAILGAGFGGIGAAIRLKQAGIEDFTVFERADEVGGTWRDNTYPGAACDVPSHVYSFSFEQKPDWSRAFAGSEEIQQYLLDVVEKYDLRKHMRFGKHIAEARFDETTGSWTLATDEDEVFTARAVIAAVGGLVDPQWPDIKGLHSFSGEMFHTARWNHDYDVAGQKVAVIGTGCSAIQVVPSIADQTEKLTVFQRTPGWVLPKPDRVYSERAKKRLARFPFLLHALRSFKYWMSELFGPMIFLDAPRLKRWPERQSLRFLERSVKDPELRRKLTPDFQFGCKRIMISDDYWSTLDRDDVELVTEPIEEIKSEGILTKDGTLHAFDAIILATGFEVGLSKAPFPVFGRGGRSLDDAWKDGAVAYKGMTVSGFPNWFTIMGPNTGPGHTSVLVYTEAQIGYALQAIDRLRAEKLRFVDVKQTVQDRYNEGIQKRMKHMVWGTCKSWYVAEDGSNHALYPGYAAEYVWRTRRFEPSEYEVARF